MSAGKLHFRMLFMDVKEVVSGSFGPEGSRSLAVEAGTALGAEFCLWRWTCSVMFLYALLT